MIRYTLNYTKKDGTRGKSQHETFASAASAASGLQDYCKVMWLNATIDQSHTGSLYKYKHGTRECINPGFKAVVLAEIQRGSK